MSVPIALSANIRRCYEAKTQYSTQMLGDQSLSFNHVFVSSAYLNRTARSVGDKSSVWLPIGLATFSTVGEKVADERFCKFGVMQRSRRQ